MALSQLILRALGSAVNDETWLDAALPEDFHPKLRQRLAKALVAALPAWREASVASQVRRAVACQRARAHTAKTCTRGFALLAGCLSNLLRGHVRVVQVSLPRLLDADCRVAVAAASSAGGASSSSAVTTLRLRVEGVATRVDSVPAPRDVLVVMDRVTLAAAVHSADNLRRRLAAVAGQQGGSTAEAR